MAVPCKCGGIANTYSSQMLSESTKKSWVQCGKCMRISTRLDEEADVLFEGIPQGSANVLPPQALRLRGRNAGILRRAIAMAEAQLELSLIG